ncbi:MAG TPA: MFS transporter, partial [Pseudonocardiaceae bacterium]|nr:MFS transporter [Pseudonocardiaceae bacterium]
TAGRLLAGVASGAAFGPGTAWVKELSAPGTGARRAVIGLSAGFGGGPLVAGVLAQWLPLPTVLPYLVHIGLMAVIIPLAWHAPETVPPEVPGRRGELRAALRRPEFRYQVAPAAPLVFGVPTVSFAVLPGLLRLHGLGAVVAGALAGLTLGTGVVVQPLARRLDQRRPGSSHYAGIALAATGFVLGAVAVHWAVPELLVPTAIVLGGCYGMLLVAGLSTVERLAAPEDLASVTAVFYCLTYVGFAAPYVVTAIAPVVPPPVTLLIAAAFAAVLIPVTALSTVPLRRSTSDERWR